MNTVLVINLTGTSLFVSYYLLRRFSEGRVNSRILYGLLRINVICFLCPLWIVGDLHRNLQIDLRYLFGIPVQSHFVYTPTAHLYILSESGLRFSQGMKEEMIVVGIFIGLAIFLFFLMILRERQWQSPFRQASMWTEQNKMNQLQSLSTQYRIRRKISLCAGLSLPQTATFGFLRPVILLQEPRTEQEREWMLRHELCHIRRWDVFWKTLARIIGVIWFFNPAARMLYGELDQMCEQSCDEMLTEKMNLQDRKRYATMLVEYSGTEHRAHCSGAIFLSRRSNRDSFQKMEERVRNIMKQGLEKKKIWNRWGAVLICGAVLWTVSLTTLAYTPIYEYYPSGTEDKFAEYLVNPECSKVQKTWFTQYPNFETQPGDIVLANNLPILYDVEYIDGNGNIYPTKEFMEQGANTNSICIFHSYQECSYSQHFLTSSGGCEVYEYSFKQCVKCGKKKNETLIAHYFYDMCPH